MIHHRNTSFLETELFLFVIWERNTYLVCEDKSTFEPRTRGEENLQVTSRKETWESGLAALSTEMETGSSSLLPSIVMSSRLQPLERAAWRKRRVCARNKRTTYINFKWRTIRTAHLRMKAWKRWIRNLKCKTINSSLVCERAFTI